MFKKIIVTYLLLLQVLVASADMVGFSKENPLLFGIDLDYPPLEYIDAKGLPSGLDVDFTRELLRRMQIPFTYQPNTWEDISDDIIQGRVDLGMMVYSPYRKDMVYYSRAVFRLYYQAVYRSDNSGFFDMRNLKGKTVAYMASRPVTDTLVNAGAKPLVIRDLTQALKELSDGRYDAVICFRYQAKYLINKHKLKNLQAEDLTLTPREYCFVSTNKELIDSINVYLTKMKYDGSITRIYGEDVTSEFEQIIIPRWVWYLLFTVAFLMMIVLLGMQLRHNKQLRHEVDRAHRSENLKTVLLGNISHALRTPLNAIIGFSDILKQSEETMIDEERAEFYDQINSNGHQLYHFVEELLELSNIETCEINEEDRCRVEEVAAECQDEIGPSVAEGVTFKVSSQPLEIRMNRSMLKTVFMHLLANSASNTTKGTIELTYRAEKRNLIFEVSDTGPGLPEGFSTKIFMILADKETFNANEDVGLGLTICRSIVKKYDGEITVDSTPNNGCTFRIVIPNVVVRNKEKSQHN